MRESASIFRSAEFLPVGTDEVPHVVALDLLDMFNEDSVDLRQARGDELRDLLKERAKALGLHEFELASVVLVHDLACDRQTKAHTIGFRGKVRVEDPVGKFAIHAWTVVREDNFQPPVRMTNLDLDFSLAFWQPL